MTVTLTKAEYVTIKRDYVEFCILSKVLGNRTIYEQGKRKRSFYKEEYRRCAAAN